MEPRELAERSFRFLKVPAKLLLNKASGAQSDIHPEDLADLLARSGIDLIAERIESESTVLDLLDYDVRFGQGFLFAPPRPLRPEGAASPTEPAGGSNAPSAAPAVDASARKEDKADVRAESPRATGNAALVRRASAQK